MALLKAEKHRILAIHLAPACGTASKAREKPLKAFRNKGLKVPVPLRSKDKPMGLDGLSGLDKVRTESANLVYAATATITQFCIENFILCSLENPQNSLFWDFPDVAKVVQQYGYSVYFEHCMHGGSRNKKTRWWSSEEVFGTLSATCDGRHSHAHWNPVQVGKSLSFPTAEEAAYPLLLCRRIVAILAQYAVQHGAHKPENLTDQLPTKSTTAHRWIMDMLPRESGVCFQAEFCTIGVPREPWDFVEQACKVGHPRSMALHLSSEVTNMLRDNFEIKEHANFFSKWSQRCKELEPEEKALHNRLEPHLQCVLQGKRLLLMKEMLDYYGYPDTSLVSDIQQGFPLTGWLPKSNIFPVGMKRPTQSVSSAKQVAKGINHGICKQVSQATDVYLASEVWEQTKEEISNKWVWIDDDCNPNDHLLAKRFGLRQGDKTRLIDDCSVGGFNATCGVSERLQIHSIDEMASYIAWCLTNLSDSSMDEVVGKTYDLKSAYKQYGVRAADRDLLRIATWDAEQARVRFLGINALPFGAVASVSAFLRVSMALWFLGLVGLRLCCTSFFDDYTLLSRKINASSASTSAECLFQLLGIFYAKEGKKAVDWSTQVKTLGVLLNLCPKPDEELGRRFVTIGHTESRIAELQHLITEILTLGKISCKEAERLRGRLQWFETFAHGRVAHQSLRVISSLASVGRQKESLGTKEIAALVFLRDRVLTAPPTKIMATNLKTWIIFSDGACEGENQKLGSVGAVFFSEDGKPVSFFSEKMESDWMDLFLESSAHPVFELELLPVLVALCAWRDKLCFSQAIFYLDNEAAKGALIQGSTPSSSGDLILRHFVCTEMSMQVKVWFSRVPTSSNVADKPSRLDVTELSALGVNRVNIQWSPLLKQLREIRSLEWG